MSTGKGRNRSRSSSSGFSESFIAPFQVPFLQSLGGQALGLAEQQAGIGGTARGLSDQLQRSGNALLGGLQDIAGGRFGQGLEQSIGGLLNLGGSTTAQALSDRLLGTAQPGQSTLQALAGGAAIGPGTPLAGSDVLTNVAQGLGQQLQGPNPGLQPSINALDAAIQDNLQSTLGTIAGQATLAGQTGGSRQALASGLAGQEAQRQFAQGAAGLVSQDFATRQALAPQILQAQAQAGQQLGAQDLAVRQLAQQGAGLGLEAALGLQRADQFQTGGLLDLLGIESAALTGAGQLGLGQAGAQASAGQAGLGALSGLFNLGLAPFSAAFSPLLAAAEVIGGPTVLSRSRQESTSRGKSDSFSVGI